MKKSIAFLGALLFGSVTFGQVTKNDSIKKPSSRKVSAEDMKNFPVDAETTIQIGDEKGKTLEKHKGEQQAAKNKSNTYIKYERTEKHNSDASAVSKINGVTQKGKDGIVVAEKMGGDASAKTTEKHHHTIKLTNAGIKMTNASKKASTNGNESGVIKEGATTTQKKHVSNIKWSGDKKVKDSLPTPSEKSTDMFLKITDIKGEKEGIVTPPTSTKSSDMFLKIGDIKGEK